MTDERGAVAKGPDLFADNDFRPYVRISDDTQPFADEEAVYVAATTTRRSAAIPLTEADFADGGLPHEPERPWSVGHASGDHSQASPAVSSFSSTYAERHA
ncbi:hypothetical protein [Halorubrum trapanicum]|uniref:hypothetical protein n=1 Tax=Halorubrum trapanicum TaxID=29284 RepID=UPI0037430706